jgi:uncharacterized membrane protein (DUF373 family)
MWWKNKLLGMKAEFMPLSIYQRFERIVVYILTALIAIVVVEAVWNLVLKILFELVLKGDFDASNYAAFQSVFGTIFVVIIALEFKKSLLVVAERHDTILQMRSVVVIALLTLCRKLIVFDVGETDALHILAVAVALASLGLIYWLIPSVSSAEMKH